MDKEKIITIAVGLLIGLLAAGGYFLFFRNANKSETPKPVTIESKQPSSDNNTVIIKSDNFTWDLPQNSSITSEKIASVSGKAALGTKIIILSNADQDALLVGTDGKFSTQINLEDGENKISLTYINKDKPPVTIVRQVFLEI